jgi:hypothetical protein
MTQKKEIQQTSELLEKFKNEMLQYEKAGKHKLYRTLWLFAGIFSLAVLIGLGFVGDKVKSLGIHNFSSLIELFAAFSLSLASGTLTTIIFSKNKTKVKNSALKEFIKHTYLTRLNESKINPQNSIIKQ